VNYTKQDFNDSLDKIHGTVEIAGRLYTTSEALQAVDPNAYNMIFYDWLTRWIK